MHGSYSVGGSNDKKKKKFVDKVCSVKMLKKRVPILSWLPKYRFNFFTGDLVAGITVALTVIPQSMAYAGIANLPPQYGLYSSFIGCFLYIFFGSVKDLAIGPTAILSLMCASHNDKGGPAYIIVLCFLSGAVQLVLGSLNLGFVVDFISTPVISAFTSAAAIIIAASQLKGLLGLKFETHDFIQTIYKICVNIKDTNLSDLTMGLIVVVVLLLLRALRNSGWPKNSTSIPPKIRKPLYTFIWIFTTARNAVVVMVCAGIAVSFLNNGIGNLTLTGHVKTGLPDVAVPPFTPSSFNSTTNTTTHTSFLDVVKDLGTGIIILPLISILESVAIAKVFAEGKKIDATQEILALGLINLVASFFSSMPVTGSFSRSAINSTSGVRTPLGGLYTGAIVLIALGFLAPTFKYIPKSALSAMILVAVIFMISPRIVLKLWKVKKTDLIVYIITFFTCLGFGLEYGIIIGVGVSIFCLMFYHARPTVTFQRATICGYKCIKVKPDRGVFYPSCEHIRSKIFKESKDDDTVVIFDSEFIYNADYTSLTVMELMIAQFIKNNQIVIFVNVQNQLFDLFTSMKVTDVVRISNDDCNIENMIQDAMEAKAKPVEGIDGAQNDKNANDSEKV